MNCRNKHRLTALSLAAVMTLLAGCGAAEEAASSEKEELGIAVQTETVAKEEIATENRVSGRVSAENTSTIMVAAAAKCTAVHVEAGDKVEAGDVICTLDLGSTLASYNAATIGYESARQSYQDQKSILDQQVALAADNVENTKALFAIGAASQLEVDQAQLNYQSAVAGRNSALSQLEAGIQSAKSGVEQLSDVMENVDSQGNIVAPISGTLVSLSASEGSFVTNTMPVAIIDGAEQMKITVSVSESLVPKLAIGDKADVTVSAAGKSFTAEIRSVEQAANMQTQLYTVTLAVPADVTGLLSGMFADVTLHTDRVESAVVVPTEAILSSGDARYVYIVDGETARHVAGTTGLTGSGVTEVTSGLTGGEQLVTVGQAYLTDGALVRIVSGEA